MLLTLQVGDKAVGRALTQAPEVAKCQYLYRVFTRDTAYCSLYHNAIHTYRWLVAVYMCQDLAWAGVVA